MPRPQYQSHSKNIVRKVTLVTRNMSTFMTMDSGSVTPALTVYSLTSDPQ